MARDNDTHPIVAQLTDLRKRRRISRSVVARRIGVPTGELHLWENGSVIPSVTSTQRWAAALVRRVAVRARGGPILGDPTGALLIELRLNHGLYQFQVAMRAWTTQSHVASWERGARNPNLWSLSRWAGALDCDLITVPTDPSDRQNQDAPDQSGNQLSDPANTINP